MATFEGWFDQADTIAFFIRIYLGEWQLPILPKTSYSRESSLQALLPPKDLFSEDAREILRDALKKMDEALESMLLDYKALDAYVRDETTIDEGLKGKRLARAINKAHERFTKARKTYYSIIQTEGLAAEDLFLTQAPLRRQILAARALFDQFQTVAFALSEEKVDRTATRILYKNIQAILQYAGMPPFRDSPGYERLYRAFLKDVTHYLEVLNLGNEEGFSTDTRHTLNLILANCRTSYNTFVHSYK